MNYYSLNGLIVFFLSVSSCGYSQQNIVKTFKTSSNTVEIKTEGLDDVVIQHSDSEDIEVSLFDENPNAHIIATTERSGIVTIDFNLDFTTLKETVFRKYITSRLQRASAVVKLPKDKHLTIFGTNINITAKNYQGNLSVFIDKGNIRLGHILDDVHIKLYAGNIYGTYSNNTAIGVFSNLGTIKVNAMPYNKSYESQSKTTTHKLLVKSIKAHVFLEKL